MSILHLYILEEHIFNLITNISFFINTRNNGLKKIIPYFSAVHMPFKNAVVYILLYGTAECY